LNSPHQDTARRFSFLRPSRRAMEIAAVVLGALLLASVLLKGCPSDPSAQVSYENRLAVPVKVAEKKLAQLPQS